MSNLDEAKTILVNTLIGILDNDFLKYQPDPVVIGPFTGATTDKEVLLVKLNDTYAVCFKLYNKSLVRLIKMQNNLTVSGITIVSERLSRKIKQRYDWCCSQIALNEINSFLDFLPEETKCTPQNKSSKKLLSEHR